MLALRRAATAAASMRTALPAQSVAFSSDRFKDKERAAESSYFNKEDEKALRKLLKKLKGQADVTDKSGLKDHVDYDVNGLKKINGLDLSQDQIDALLKWKHDH